MTLTVPAKPPGEVAVQTVVDEQLMVALVVPNSAVVAPATKPLPVTVTEVPPRSGPALGLTELTVGMAS